MSANVLAAVFTLGGVTKAISHHWIIVEGSDGKYHRFEFGGYSKHSSWSDAMSTFVAERKGKNYSYRAAKVEHTYNGFFNLETMIQFTNGYKANYGDYHEWNNNCQHFARRFRDKFLK